MAIKPFIMDNAVVVGVGNIYASEALFAAGIDPRREAGSVSRTRYVKLAAEIKRILDLYGDQGEGHAQQLSYVIARTDEAIAEMEKRRAQIDETLAELRVINANCRVKLAAQS